jgi:hypothetical protein
MRRPPRPLPLQQTRLLAMLRFDSLPDSTFKTNLICMFSPHGYGHMPTSTLTAPKAGQLLMHRPFGLPVNQYAIMLLLVCPPSLADICGTPAHAVLARTHVS